MMSDPKTTPPPSPETGDATPAPAPAPAAPAAGEDSDSENEVLATVRQAKEQAVRAAQSAGIGWKTAAAGLGIGSAALLAALLYSNRNKS